MMGRIGRKSREHFADLIMNIVRRDEVKVTDALVRLTISDEVPNHNALERYVA